MAGGEVAGMSLMWKIRLIKRVAFRLIGYGSELKEMAMLLLLLLHLRTAALHLK